jgi:hypothetical protein
MSNKVIFTMFDVANMLIEIQDIKAENAYYEERGQLGVDFIKEYIGLEMLAYKTYIAVCNREGLVVSKLVRYEHCQSELTELREWFDHRCHLDNTCECDEYEDGRWQAEEQLLIKLHNNNHMGAQ